MTMHQRLTVTLTIPEFALDVKRAFLITLANQEGLTQIQHHALRTRVYSEFLHQLGASTPLPAIFAADLLAGLNHTGANGGFNPCGVSSWSVVNTLAAVRDVVDIARQSRDYVLAHEAHCLAFPLVTENSFEPVRLPPELLPDSCLRDQRAAERRGLDEDAPDPRRPKGIAGGYPKARRGFKRSAADGVGEGVDSTFAPGADSDTTPAENYDIAVPATYQVQVKTAMSAVFNHTTFIDLASLTPKD